MNRTNSRILATFALYNHSFDEKMNIEECFIEEVKDYDKDYYQLLIDTVLSNLSDIDYYIAKNLDNYSIDRLNLVDLNILRVAIGEMKYLGLAPQIAINEAIENSKEYTETDVDKTHKFNNKLLDKIRKDLGL